MIIIETCPKCGHDLIDLMFTCNPPIPKKQCFNCGWSWTGEREEVMRVSFGGNSFAPDITNHLNTNIDDIVDITHTGNYLNNVSYEDSIICNFEQSACINCPNNPRNGGSGNCNCTLGQQITY